MFSQRAVAETYPPRRKPPLLVRGAEQMKKIVGLLRDVMDASGLTSAIFAFCLSTPVAFANLDKYSALVVADPPETKQTPWTVRVTYLGVNGYQLEANGRALLVDPYFTRTGLTAVALQQPIEPNEARIAFGLQYLQPRPDAVLVTHAHFDHLLDVAEIMRRTNARLIAGKTAANFTTSCGIDRDRCLVVQPGSTRVIGPWRIRVLPAAHDRILGWLPFPGTKTHPGPCPAKASDWRLGEPLAFLIEANGKRIYIDSGGISEVLPSAQIAPVDLAILGVALLDSRKRFRAAVDRLRPKYVLPSHQDDMFAPVERGFAFGKLTDFPAVVRPFQRHEINSHLILLDYFRPWTIP
jgi:L-ascorbate metabolism protein UlaG (beta-lactamase superfamily)